MTTKNDDAATDLLIQEVDDELRQERLNLLWKKYGNVFVAGSVAVVLAVAGWQGWNGWQMRQRQESGARFSEAVALAQQGKPDQAAEALNKLVNDGSSGYRVLAQLKLADLRQDAGDSTAAAALNQRVADGPAAAPYRDLARLKAAYQLADTAQPAEIEKLAEPLAVESSPWRHSARELLALAALKKGDAAKAGDLFRKIADDPAAPQGVRARAAEMLAATGKAKG